ncbi:MarR family winged helix-turn-helix transcriptional regulator [Actinomadura scrupuli]|uniref:MarR family winged helix-turn-helix transcriptional regulator n=1 Tax=Actinomadura scrupuli TaxID=559629 RepID=UPI003D951FCC
MTAPRWLSDDEQRTWRSLVVVLTRLDEALDRQLQRDAGMPHAYYMILVMLSEADGRALRMSDLSAMTTYSQSRLSHAAARLEEKGWIRRERSPADKRGSVAVLTDAGFTALAEAAPGHVEEVRRRVFDPLTGDEAERLRAICDKILAAL